MGWVGPATDKTFFLRSHCILSSTQLNATQRNAISLSLSLSVAVCKSNPWKIKGIFRRTFFLHFQFSCLVFIHSFLISNQSIIGCSVPSSCWLQPQLLWLSSIDFRWSSLSPSSPPPHFFRLVFSSLSPFSSLWLSSSSSSL